MSTFNLILIHIKAGQIKGHPGHPLQKLTARRVHVDCRADVKENHCALQNVGGVPRSEVAWVDS